jgi:hypothetical protein
MSNQKSNKENLALAESVAANQLMTQWVKENASEVAGAISNLVPFICGECDTAGLEHSMNIVNTVFANVALDVIKSRNNVDGEKETPLCLPVDATSMQNALYELSRFLNMFHRMGYILKSNENLPAFRLSLTAYDEVESI